MSACSGFTQYAYAFLHVESEEAGDPASANGLAARARRMYARARGYCLRALALTRARLAETLTSDPRAAIDLLELTTREDVPALYWSGSAWAGEFSLATDQLVRMPELALVRALLERALLLDETWERGAIYESLIALEGLPFIAGGSAARARKYFERADVLSEGASAQLYVTFATSVALRARNRPEFEALLKRALSVDVNRRPELRLANLVGQKRAKSLLSRGDDLFRSR
jgi:hypothetical protein